MSRTQRPPNILIFMTDQEQSDVSLPGNACQTPNADRLAREGVQFTNAYCPTAHCCPARASLMTGVYPSIHGVYNNIANPTAIRRAPRPGLPMFSEGLREAGYRMIYSGKWHVSMEEGPGDRGWEELVVTGGKGAGQARGPELFQRTRAESAGVGDSSGGERPWGVVRRPGWGDYTLFRTLPTQGNLGYDEKPDWRVVSPALGALEQLTKSADPWCLYVGPIGPHDPFHVPDVFVNRYNLADVPLPASYHDSCEDKPRTYQRMRQQYWDQLSEEEIRDAVRHYWAYCTMEDTYFGLFLDALDASGQREDTLVVRLSDHGEYAGAHGLFCKGVPAFREGYNVPCIMSWPGGVQQPGRVEDSFVTLADIGPTLLDVAGVPVPDGLTGRSMAPFLQGEQPEGWRDAFYSQMNGVELYYTQRTVQTKEWKYVYNGFDFDELYDLRADPHETVNLAAKREYDEVKRELVHKMWQFAHETNDHIFNGYATVAFAPWGPADAEYAPRVTPPARE
ncbi:MAG TPA: sulfatase-like hydrolase/transferase [Chloroflexota bacterium]|nr:sulfatase-like hydrolase/transferase [Chloroflexota bacterium]